MRGLACLTSPPKRRVLRWLAGCAATVVVLAASLICLARYVVLNPRRLHDSLERQIESRLGFSVRLGPLDYEFPDFLEANGLHAELPETTALVRSLRARRVSAEVDIGRLFRGQLLLRRLVFLGLQTTLDLAD